MVKKYKIKPRNRLPLHGRIFLRWDPARVTASETDNAVDKGARVGCSERAEELLRLFRDHNRSLVLFLASRLKDIQAAHEVAQEAYVRVLQLQSPGAVSFLRSYLF